MFHLAVNRSFFFGNSRHNKFHSNNLVCTLQKGTAYIVGCALEKGNNPVYIEELSPFNSQKIILFRKTELVKDLNQTEAPKYTQNLIKTDVIDHLRRKEDNFNYTLVQPDKTQSSVKVVDLAKRPLQYLPKLASVLRVKIRR